LESRIEVGNCGGSIGRIKLLVSNLHRNDEGKIQSFTNI
jgi:hypothetical protein